MLCVGYSRTFIAGFDRMPPYLAHWIKDFHKSSDLSYGNAGLASGRRFMLDEKPTDVRDLYFPSQYGFLNRKADVLSTITGRAIC